MSWYEESGVNPFQYRHPIAVDNLVASTSAVDVQITLPNDWPLFWDNVRSAGEDVRVCLAAGDALAVFDLNGFSVANKTGTLELQSLTPPAQNCMHMAWLYWGSSDATSALTTFTPSSPRTGYIYADGVAPPIVVSQVPRPGRQQPAPRVSKAAADDIYIWHQVVGRLTNRRTLYNGSLARGEISYVTQEVLSNGVDQSSQYDETSIRFLDRGLVRALTKAGTTATDYTHVLTVVTTDGDDFEVPTLLSVKNLREV